MEKQVTRLDQFNRSSMGKRVPSVGQMPTDSSSELPGRPMTRVYLFGAANIGRVIHAVSMRTSSACCGCNISSVCLADT